MSKKLVLILIFLFPIILFAQSAFNDCDPVFTKLKILPSLKISNEAFGDSLSILLKFKKYPFDDHEITYRLVVTNNSKIDDLIAITGNATKEKKLKEAILELSDLWKPAIVNGHEVCAQILLKLKFTGDKINVIITQ